MVTVLRIDEFGDLNRKEERAVRRILATYAGEFARYEALLQSDLAPEQREAIEKACADLVDQVGSQIRTTLNLMRA